MGGFLVGGSGGGSTSGGSSSRKKGVVAFSSIEITPIVSLLGSYCNIVIKHKNYQPDDCEKSVNYNYLGGNTKIIVECQILDHSQSTCMREYTYSYKPI